MKKEDIVATRQSAILGEIINYCGRRLTADDVDDLTAKILRETLSGPYSWAFSSPYQSTAEAPQQLAKEQEMRCEVPPIGWKCTRRKGHDGPCAAVPTKCHGCQYLNHSCDGDAVDCKKKESK